MVPVVKLTHPLVEVMHLLCQFQDRFRWNEMISKGFLEVLPGAEGDWVFGECQAMTPAVSSGRRVVDGYVKVGPNWWSRCSDVSGV